MKLALLVYLASIVDNLSLLFFMIGFWGSVIYFGILAVMHFSGFGTRVYSCDTDEEINKQKNVKNAYTKYWKLNAIIFLVLLFLAAIMPKEKTIYIMAGAYVTEQIATNERVQKIGSDVLEVIEGKLNKMKDEK